MTHFDYHPLATSQRAQAGIRLVENPPRPPYPRRTGPRCLPKEHRLARSREGDHEGCSGLGGESKHVVG